MGKDSQFVDLINQHKGVINKVVFLYADNSEDRKDLRQEIISQAWGAFNSFRGHSKFSTWLYRVAMNVAISSFKHHNKRKGLSIKLNTSDSSSGSSSTELLEHILRILNPIEKSVVLLQIEGYTQPEIAHILGLSNVNTRTKIYRIRKKLRKHGIDQLT